MHPAALLSRFNSKFFSEKKMKMKCLYNIYASPIKSPNNNKHIQCRWAPRIKLGYVSAFEQHPVVYALYL